MSEGNIHQPIRGTWENSQEGQVEEYVVRMLFDFVRDTFKFVLEIVVNNFTKK